MSEISVGAVGRRLAPIRSDVARTMRPQVTVMSGQLVAGVGNLLFAVVLARVFTPAQYSDIVAFLALYVLLHVPALALSAAGALAPDRLALLGPRVAVVGAAVGAGLVAASGPIGSLLGMPSGLIMALGVAAPAAGLLSLQRGLGYGREEHRRVAASLVTEPVVRLVAGVAFAGALGPVGAAIATVLAGYAALAVCAGREPAWRLRPAVGRPSTSPTVSTAGALSVGLAFVSLAVLASTDLLVANRVLDPVDAAQFGVLSTLGGAAFFATATIPLVLMPAAVRGRPHAAATAVAMTGGGRRRHRLHRRRARPPVPHPRLRRGVRRRRPPRGAVPAGDGPARRRAGAGRPSWRRRRGPGLHGRRHRRRHRRRDHRHRRGRPLRRCRRRHHAVLHRRPRRRARDAARRGPQLDPHPHSAAGPRGSRCGPWPACAPSPSARAVATTAAYGSTRPSAWARPSCRSARCSTTWPTTDVHPPLHHTLLWLTVRVFGTSEFAVRLPSLIAGVALVPVALLGRARWSTTSAPAGWPRRWPPSPRSACGTRRKPACTRSVHAPGRDRHRGPGPGDPPRPDAGLGALRPGHARC